MAVQNTPSRQNTQGRRPEQNTGQTPQPSGGGAIWLWLAIMFGLLLWNLVALWPRSGPRAVTIPYSTFRAQVMVGNISQVKIADYSITGAFIKPIQWPPAAKAATTSQATKPAEPAQAAKPAQPSAPEAVSRTYKDFRTVYPATIGDPTLIPLLEAHHVMVTASPQSSDWLVQVLINWFPMILLIGFFWWMGSRLGQSQAGMFNRITRMGARRYSAEQSSITFKDVAGQDEAKANLQEEVDFLRHPEKYREVGARIPKGVLLVGPPGTGKTLLARAVAGEAGVPFFSLNASEFVEMFVGVGASRVRDLFGQAKAAAPAIIFIDELDAVGRRRGAGVGAVNDEREQTLNQLLGELDGFDERTNVVLLAATNRPDVLDPALLRPGRFDRRVIVALPDRRGREGILHIHTRRLHLAGDVALGDLARSTIGMSGADLANLCNEAALAAARNNRVEVRMADFEEAMDRLRLGVAQPQLLDPSERGVVAYHESGHAVVAWLTPDADPVRKVTIVPHGQALGRTEQLPGEERHNFSQSYLLARLAVLLGGRTAEEVAFGEVTTGAENDLQEATRLARRMVTRWGMGKMGVMAFRADEDQPFLGYEMAQRPDYSEATAARIDQDIQTLLENTHQEVKRRLTEGRAGLDRLVAQLLKEETVGVEELEHILGPRPEGGKGPVPADLLNQGLPHGDGPGSGG